MKKEIFKPCISFFSGVLAVYLMLPMSNEPLLAQTPSPAVSSNLTRMSLEDLMDTEVRSVSRKQQKLSQTAAAVYVLSADTIRRSGATSIPEALRMVPGVQVAQIDANRWAVSARGYSYRFADKLLVLIDGRSIYTNLFSGMFWEQNNLSLDEIARIEVIRGPGATVWGANAVNGVINIITKDSVVTKGLLVSTDFGNQERGSTIARYGEQAGENLWYRGSIQVINRAPFSSATGGAAFDHGRSVRGAGRIDWSANESDKLILQGDLYTGGMNQTFFPNWPGPPLTPPMNERISTRGGYGRLRWERSISDLSSMAFQSSFSSEYRNEEQGRVFFRNLDFDFQYQYSGIQSNNFVWGLDYRRYQDEITQGGQTQFVPDRIGQSLYSGFIQDDISIVPDQFVLTVGTKLQHNAYSGLEIQPGARAVFRWTENRSLWTSVSRSVRTPNRRDHDLKMEFQTRVPQTIGRLVGNKDFDSEEMISYEAGLRQQVQGISFDFATFHNRYNQTRRNYFGEPFLETSPTPQVVIPIVPDNSGKETVVGLEATAVWATRNNLDLTASYTWLQRNQVDTQNPVSVGFHEPGQRSDARNRFYANSRMDMGNRMSWDVSLYYVSQLRTEIPSYTRLDTRLGWVTSSGPEINLVFQNLLKNRHVEFCGLDFVQSSEIRRSAYLQLRWGF